MRSHTLTGSLRGCRSLEFSLKGGVQYSAGYVVQSADRGCIVAAPENIYDKA